VSLWGSGPGVGKGFLETPRTRFGGVFLAAAQTASQSAVPQGFDASRPAPVRGCGCRSRAARLSVAAAARRRGRRRHPRLGEQRVFSRRQCPPSYFRSSEHLLRYCARPPFALERLSVSRGADGQIAGIRYVLPRHWVTIWAANWVGPSRSRKSTRPGANGVVDLSPFEFLDRLADLVPPPRKHRHRYHGVFAPNHKLRSAVTALTIGNVGKRGDTAAGGYAAGGHTAGEHATGGCCDANHANQKPRSHDTSRIAWAKLMARVGEEFPLACPTCGGDIRLREDGRQEPAHFEPEVRKRAKARMASPA